ncbi:DNA-3-methyladenine glycosylase 2 family protein [Eubacteriales bacterium OttesenSCG-928-M02]|nr:DNA-3-methyladenine glycosylase 2 family protein [Eubacteriales bacterium OttesenSCG-928-M02]
MYQIKAGKGFAILTIQKECLDLSHTFSSGQAFRFYPTDRGYRGIANGRVLEITALAEGEFQLYPVDGELSTGFWKWFLDLDTDYSAIHRLLSFDEPVREGIAYAPGMRLLNQDPFETTISFILSANNNIRRIQHIIEHLCKAVGKPIEGGYAFPTPQAIAALSEMELRSLGMGYRARYVQKTAQMVADGFDLPTLAHMEYPAAKAAIQSLPGVGPKVADCILLFSLGHRCAFPQDTWVKKCMEKYYGLLPGQNVESFVEQRFGHLAGYANHYLFHHIRNREENH